MIHGGDIYRNEVELDFSINVNPLGMPERVRQALFQAVSDCTKYPDPEMERLTDCVRNVLGVKESSIVFGNGASELFQAVIHTIRPKKILIPVPAFYGYEYADKCMDSEICYYMMKKEKGYSLDERIFTELEKGMELLFLANPNNPTGCLLDGKLLERILTYCREKQIYVVLDECFIEFCEESESMLPKLAAYPNLILVRAFTKIFAIPGVRLGYLLSEDANLVKEIRRHLPEWNISTFAQAAGVACAAEWEFVSRTKAFLKEERNFLYEGLKKEGLTVFSGAANFLLIQTEIPLYEELLKRKILVRDCSNFRGLGKGFYRIAVKTREENEKLLEKIGEIK